MLLERLREILAFRRRKRASAEAVELPPAEMAPIDLKSSGAEVISVHTGVLPSQAGMLKHRKARGDYWDYLVGFVVIALVFLGGRAWLGRDVRGDAADSQSRSTFWSLPERAIKALRANETDASAREARGDNFSGYVEENPDTPAQATRKVAALYSEEARAARFRGKIFVTVIVNEQGVPVKIEPTSPIPFNMEVPVRNAVLQWRFEPAMKGGQVVASRTLVEVPME